jgi:hypothetical protein
VSEETNGKRKRLIVAALKRYGASVACYTLQCHGAVEWRLVKESGAVPRVRSKVVTATGNGDNRRGTPRGVPGGSVRVLPKALGIAK